MSSRSIGRPLALALSVVSAFAADASAGAACGLPLPDPGQTVTWTASGSPYAICQNMTVPEGGTVLIEAGVQLDFLSNYRIQVDGRMEAQGTAGARVTIAPNGPGVLNVSGELQLDFTDVGVLIEQASGSATLLHDSTVTAAGSFKIDIPLNEPMFVEMQRCQVATPFFTVTGDILLRDVAFASSTVELRGYSLIDGVTSQGGTVILYRDFQPMYVDGLQVSGANGPGLKLRLADSSAGTDFLLGPGVSLSANTYPVELIGHGLHPSSVVPTSGNTHDAILAAAENGVYEGRLTWPELGVPYHVTNSPQYSGRLDVHPGVTIQLGTGGSLGMATNAFHNEHSLRGLPGNPIRLEPINPGSNWLALVGLFGLHLFEHLEIEGAGVGVSSPQSTVYLRNSTIRDCAEGVAPSGLGRIIARGVRFLQNTKGAVTDMSALSGSTGLDLDGFEQPNIFAGNTIAIDNITPNSSVTKARRNWWNHASGPFQSTTNPSGQGDPVAFQVDYSSWLSSAPSLTNTPPVVRMTQPFFLAEPGSKIHLRWDASDDGAIVAQSILLDTTGGGVSDFKPIVTDLSPDARSYEWTVPDIGFSTSARPMLMRVVAVDNAGLETFDQVSFHIPKDLPQGNVQILMDVNQVYHPAQFLKPCWSAFGVTSSPLQTYIILDGDERMMRGPSGWSGDACAFGTYILPRVSTDSARLALWSNANGNVDEWYFSEPFSIRPDARLGDAAPTISVTSPTAGQTYPGGAVVPVTWTATDDEGIRSSFVQASFDGGRTWHRISGDLPGNTTAYNWSLPASAGVSNVRVRVVVKDLRFQNSSDEVVVHLSPGTTQVCQKDLGFAGPGTMSISVCGDALSAGGTADLLLAGAPPQAPLLVLASLTANPTLAYGGTLVPLPVNIALTLSSDATGELRLPGIPGGGGPLTLYLQALAVDGSLPLGVAISNALELAILP